MSFIDISKNKDGLSWNYNGNVITLKIENIDNFLQVGDKKILLILQISKDNLLKLLIYNFKGELLFDLSPPKGFLFSYLTKHPEVEVAVVCSSDDRIEGWYDWHFKIDPETGCLQRWCPAM